MGIKQRVKIVNGFYFKVNGLNPGVSVVRVV